ncbi:MAG: hypothetical protein AMS27_13095 [Bacteroides sp. SM23_62_1]|nr:MAG: hypothetical protein AMS27_13095 [Bacteroides sp. SM23_62_1]
MDFFTWAGFWQLLFRFAINTIWIFLISRLLYYPKQKKPEYLFSFLLIGSIVFIICNLLGKLTLSIGFAVGLFAIFAVLRYRTNPIPVKEMTYFFIIIGVSVKNALASRISLPELLFSDVAIFALTFAGEYILFKKKYISKTIIIQNIELTRPENYPKLIEELSNLSGFKVEKAEIGRVDYIKRQARIRIYFLEKDAPHSFVDSDDGD